MTLDERITRYLAKCPPAVSGSDGHGVTFKVACALVNGFALEPDDALRHLTAYNATCCPPWTPRELRHKVQEAVRKPHDKPRGYLLKGSEKPPAAVGQDASKAVPVRLTPKKRRFGTVGTTFSDIHLYAGAHTHTRDGAETENKPSQPSQEVKPPETSPEPPNSDLVMVPGCAVPRPVEIEMADDDWRKLNASGFAGEPLVQMAAWLFGPGCTVLETEAAR